MTWWQTYLLVGVSVALVLCARDWDDIESKGFAAFCFILCWPVLVFLAAWDVFQMAREEWTWRG